MFTPTVFLCVFISWSKNGYDYLSLRLWVGVWMGVFMITLCAFEISAWVAFITRFTEENFALLIATIYVYKVTVSFFLRDDTSQKIPSKHIFS